MPTFPYAQPMGAVDQIISRLRSSFPEKVDSAVLKRLAIARSNETYIINTIRFLGVIDKEGNRTSSAHDLFVLGDEDFRAGFATMIKSAYKSLFDLYGDEAWDLVKPKLIAFFRQEDKSTDLVGGRQADTFIKLAVVAGKRASTTNGTSDTPKREAPKRAKRTTSKPKAENRAEVAPLPTAEPLSNKEGDGIAAVSLAVKIEVNLPATADQSVYDAIFKSIRANLLDRD